MREHEHTAEGDAHRWIAQDSQCWCGFRAEPFQERTRYEQYLDHLARVTPPDEDHA